VPSVYSFGFLTRVDARKGCTGEAVGEGDPAAGRAEDPSCALTEELRRLDAVGEAVLCEATVGDAGLDGA
jgi:hypothetical protein